MIFHILFLILILPATSFAGDSLYAPPTDSDIAWAKNLSDEARKDKLAHAIPDGFYVFMSGSLSDEYWNDTLHTVDTYHAKIVIYGINHESLAKIKEITAQAIKEKFNEKNPEDQKKFHKKIKHLFPWGERKDTQIKPVWFDDLGVKRVPAFAIKSGKTVCMVYGAMSLRAAVTELHNRECPAFNAWASKSGITEDLYQ